MLQIHLETSFSIFKSEFGLTFVVAVFLYYQAVETGPAVETGSAITFAELGT